MKKAVVTGVAGFLGSHLCEKLLELGYEVTGIDCLTPYYSRQLKERNLESLRPNSAFTFVEGDLLCEDLDRLLDGVSQIYHLAAQPGVRSTWGAEFEVYVRNNVLTTQALLEAPKDVDLEKFVFASSSSVYGDVDEFPIHESCLPRPISPYGVSRLAAEHLCYLFWKAFEVPTIALRYPSVYGPRQRPDMAMAKFIKRILRDEEITVYGDGEQTRDFTYVGDGIEAAILAGMSTVSGRASNIGSGGRVSINDVISLLGKILGKSLKLVCQPAQPGDTLHTHASIETARELLGYKPEISLERGQERQCEDSMRLKISERLT